MAKLVTLLLALTSIMAQARIGETLSECEARYGPAVEQKKATQKDSDPESIVFSKSGITILAEFKGGKVWKISYSKVGMDISEVEILLAANSPESKWSAPLKITGQEVRSCSSHDRIAVFTPGKRLEATFTLVVASIDYATANRKEYQDKLGKVSEILKNRLENNPLRQF
jgi:hypothetical protein